MNKFQGIIGYGLYDYRPLEYDGYVYPEWANVLGWFIAGSSIAMIPAVALYQIAITPGSFSQVNCLNVIVNRTNRDVLQHFCSE